MRVVLADSDAARRKRLTAQIGGLGHHIEAHAAGESALAACRDHPAALVVLDWELARAAGGTLCRRIRSLDPEEPPYVLLVAGSVSEGRAAQLGRMPPGADDFLCAPIDDDELALRVKLAERRIVEGARMRDEHRSYMELLAQAPDLIQTVGLRGRLLHVNRAWRDALGYGERDIDDLSFFELVVPELRPSVRKAFRWVLRGHGIQHLQTELVTRAGAVMSVEGSLTPRYRGKAPTSVRVILRDVSRRKRAETVLRNVLEGTSSTTGKDFFRSLVRHLSKALGARHALVADLVEGDEPRLSTLAVWAGDSFHANREFPLADMGPAGVLQGEARAGADDSSLFPGGRFLAELGAESYLGVPLTDSEGSSIGLLCVLNDGPMPTGPDALRILTTFAQRAGAELERLRAQERLASSEARMRAMLDAMPDILLRMDAEGRYLDMHAKDPALLALPADEIVGRRLSELLPADVACACMEAVARALESGTVEMVEYRLDLERGTRQCEARLVRCGPGEVLAVVRDVTDQRTAEAERRELDRRMQKSQKLESLGVLAGGIAHDFNNLLTSIMGYASLAQGVTVPGTPAHRYLADIEMASRRAADLAMQMLAYSGKGRFVIQPLDLRELMRETANFIKTDVTARGVAVRTRLPRELPAIEGDVTQLRQVIMNLVLNAAQATEPRGGTVKMSVCETHASESELSRCYVGADLPAGRYVRFSVTDDGCGMDAATKARIFDPFFTTKPRGRGLGLAAVVGIVRGHRGALWVKSRPGEGTHVDVYFPASDKPAMAEPPAQRPAPARGEGLVLVVDDEQGLRSLTRDILESGGYRVETAADGRQGVEMLRRHVDAVDAVLLDMTMPVMNGVDAFRAMRALRPDLRVVVSSGYTEKEAINRFRGDAPASFIQKPYTAAELLRVVGEVLVTGAVRA
jgi:PAS domain S-box-containing protein